MLEIIPPISPLRIENGNLQQSLTHLLEPPLLEKTGKSPMITRLLSTKFQEILDMTIGGYAITFNLEHNGAHADLQKTPTTHLAIKILEPGEQDKNGSTKIYPILDTNRLIVLEQLMISDIMHVGQMSVEEALRSISDLSLSNNLQFDREYRSLKIIEVLRKKYGNDSDLLNGDVDDLHFYFRIYKKRGSVIPLSNPEI